MRAYRGFGLRDVSFNNLLLVEGTDLRGYSIEECQGKQLMALQGEYRYNFKGNMGLIVVVNINATFFNASQDLVVKTALVHNFI